MRRSRRLWLQTRINPVLIALLLAWSADGVLANPAPSPSASEDTETGVSPYLILGAMAVGFAATYALLLGGNERSYSRNAPATADGTSAGVPPQQPGAPGGNDTPGGDDPAEGDPAPGYGGYAITPSAAATTEAPEPGTLWLLGAGAAALFASRSRRRLR